MGHTLSALAELVGGRVEGNGQVEITGAAPLGVVKPGQLTFIDKPDRTQRLASSCAAGVLVPEGTGPLDLPAIVVADVHQAFTALVRFFRPRRGRLRIGKSPSARIDPSAQIGADVDIHPGATVEADVEIGPGSTIHAGARIMAGSRLGARVLVYPNAVLYEDTVVGSDCIIHAGAVLGADGFGYRLADGRHQLSAQLGNVVLGDRVEVGANSTIDRGTYSSTVIGEGTKIDNQVQIAHNCRIGRNNIICAQVGVAGSTSTGDWVVIAGQAGIRDHVHIGDRAVLGAMAGVMNNVPEGATYVGIPATPDREQMLRLAHLGKLPEMRKELKELKAKVEFLLAAMQHGDACQVRGDAVASEVDCGVNGSGKDDGAAASVREDRHAA